MSSKTKLTLVSQPQAFFRELLVQALRRQHVSTRAETEFYLVNLLNQFMSTDRLYARDQNGSAVQEPLALMVKEALEQTELKAQSAMFRHIGDVSLYTAGFFQESLNRKRVNLKYYIEMGGTAYRHVADLVAERLQRAIYDELSTKFAALVGVLADVSEKTTQRSEKDLIRLYEMWVSTKSERAAKALRKAGIIPDSASGPAAKPKKRLQ
ncbi:MAG: hypothetical protein A2428_03460 [Bdellovibrionales bacterium RIFOXYC1_FULL_54_43]|nr:MAG: hypothetical protein A2428_03460 [Bdellovibrionales bacterium RIFOXYC1_FULL_54_43]OFZ83496.1 MAG: hypothetical protein A2603_03490 [Bdellovibrionales bacterium RIFOXYD1_FULL_55_31]